MITIGSTQTFDANGNLVTSAGGSTNDQTELAGLNRDITKSQEITKNTITGALNTSITLDNRLFSSDGRSQIGDEQSNLGGNLQVATKQQLKLTELVPLAPTGFSIILENYTGQELSWAKGGEARFKEKGREFETAVVGANTIGKANTIDPIARPDLAYLIGQPLRPYPGYEGPSWQNEGGTISAANGLNGMNAMSVFHDKFTQDTLLGKEGLLELSIIPAIPLTYYGLIGKSIRNLYEEPKNNNLTGGKND